MKNKPKKLLEAHISCPHCKKAVLVTKYEETLKPAFKAEKKTWVDVKKDTQSKLKTGDKKK